MFTAKCLQTGLLCLSLSLGVCVLCILFVDSRTARACCAIAPRERRIVFRPGVCRRIDLIAPVYLESRVSSRTGAGRGGGVRQRQTVAVVIQTLRPPSIKCRFVFTPSRPLHSLKDINGSKKEQFLFTM